MTIRICACEEVDVGMSQSVVDAIAREEWRGKICRFLVFLYALENTHDIDLDVLKDTINQVYRLQAEVKK